MYLIIHLYYIPICNVDMFLMYLIYAYLSHIYMGYLCCLIQIQQGSPVLCHFGNHWELVGLVSESSVACYDPVLVTKTAPCLSWMRWLIKAPQKPLDPIFSLPCSFSPGVGHGIQDRLSLNRASTILTSHGFSEQSWRRRLGTFPPNRQR